MSERWEIYNLKADFDEWAKELHISPILARVMRNRGITELSEAREYLNGSIQDLSDPLLMKDMEKGAAILREAIANRIPIAISSDFDADGIFSGEILYEGITELGGYATVYTPSRAKEGYGVNRRIIDEAKRSGHGILLTCDNGISAVEETDYAREKGFRVVITDHHEVPYDLLPDGRKEYIYPRADALIDPKRPDCAYPFKGLCGTGVAFRLMEVLYSLFGRKPEELRKFYPYVAIATVADVMELRGENRILVKEGLKILRAGENRNLLLLAEACSLQKENINAYSLGFVFGPCFNTIGRIGNIELAFDFLKNKDEMTMIELAEEIHALNETRKSMTEEGFREAVRIVEESSWKDDRVLVVPLYTVDKSLVGIIAGKLKEKYGRPVLAVTRDGETESGKSILRGSGRSVNAYSMSDELMALKDMLLKFGGHKMAVGFSLPEEDLSKFRTALNERCTLTEEDLRPLVQIDVAVPLNYLSAELIEDLEKMEPCGTANPKALFARQHFRIHKSRTVGKNMNVVQMELSDETGTRRDGILFGDAEGFMDFLKENYGEEEVLKMQNGQPNQIDIAFTYEPQINDFRGERKIQVVCKNYCRISSPDPNGAE